MSFIRAPSCARRVLFEHISSTSSAPKRLSSTNGGKFETPLPPLPSHKMRALVSLYHQADTFITASTLDKAIDDAFLVHDAYSQTASRERSKGSLTREITHRRPLPRDVHPADPRKTSMVSQYGRMRVGWSEDTGSERENIVTAALFGTTEGRGTSKPGYDMLVEKESAIWRELKGNDDGKECPSPDAVEVEATASDVDELRDTTLMDASRRT